MKYILIISLNEDVDRTELLNETHGYLYGLLTGFIADLWPKMQEEIARHIKLEKSMWTKNHISFFEKEYAKLNGVLRVAKCQEFKNSSNQSKNNKSQ